MCLPLLLFNCSVVSDSLQPRGLQHTRFPRPCHLPEFARTRVQWVGDGIQPFHLLLPSSPALNLSQHQGLFQWVGSSHQVAKVLELQLIHPSLPALILLWHTHTYQGTPAPLHPLGPISSPAYSRKPSLLPVPLWNIPDASTLGGMPGPCSVSQAGRKASHLPLPTLRESSPALAMSLTMGAAPPGDLQEGSKWHPWQDSR